jgi:hypothetical protein
MAMKARVTGVALTVGLAMAAAGAAAEGVRVPGTPVVMEAPQGFVAETGFAGFGLREKQASIMVTVLPAPAAVADLRKGFTKAALAEKGITLLGEEAVTVDGAAAMLYRVAQSPMGHEFRKWILVREHGTSVVLIVGTYPLEAEAALGTPIRQSLLGTRLEKEGDDPLEGLTFRAQGTERLRLATRVGQNLLFTESGALGGTPEQALLVVGPSFSDVALDDLEAFSKARAGRIDQVRDLRAVSGRPLDVDGLSGWELLAEATDRKSETALRVYQLVLRDGSRYFMVQGLVGREREQPWVEEFRKVAASFKRTAGAAPAP